ncbi:MAG: MarR family transcriptional regulator [Lachnospiraceae bacterium]|nr:MarR family transcriptional regulator [Lachnospiraceae bacterium]
METNEVVMSGLQLKKLLSRKVEPIMLDCDLRPVELDILVFLYSEKNIDTAKGISRKKHLSKAHVSKSIDNLHSGGFVELTEDKDDHRIVHISLTEKSGKVIDKVAKVYEECRETMLKGISEEELDILKKVITKMNENINHELGE